MNSLLLKCLAVTGQLNSGDCVNLDFDHQFVAADKKDAKCSCKKADGYFPSVASIRGLIVGIENRDGNANVKFRQADTPERLFSRLERQSRVVIQNFRADCGSFSEEIIRTVSAHCSHFYIRANNCQNNDFGWAHMPFSFLKENTVFLIAIAILKNFYLHLLDVIGGRVKGLDRTARLKRFLRMFVVVPAKWIKSGRRNVLNLYTKRRINLELVR